MFLSKRHLDRRTFLRGLGATVALPLLDAMVPARALLASTRPVRRLACVYFPHGAVMNEWLPADAGRSSRLGRILEPLSSLANRLTIVGGVENRHAYGPVHAITPGTWLSGTSPRERGDAARGATIDQLAGNYLGRETALPSLALAAEEPTKIGAGIWAGQYDASLATTISFRRAGVPVAMQSSPRAVFDQLFARGGTCDAGDAPTAASTSVLDLVAADAARLRTRLGPADRTVLGDYLEAVRDAERRVEDVESRACMARPSAAEVEQRFVQRLTLMFDLTALAFRADITRVASLMMAAETSAMTYGHVGVPESFHLLSHHQHDAEKLDRLVRIQTFQTKMLAHFADTLQDVPDGDGSLLDHSLILFGSNMSDSHAHDHFPLPVALIGSSKELPYVASWPAPRLGFRHLPLPDRTPIANVLLTVLRRTGVPVESIGDSTGECGEV